MSTLNFKKIGGLTKVEHSPSGSDVYVDRNDVHIDMPVDGTSAIVVTIKGQPYNLSAITDIQIDGVAVTDQTDFETQIATVFPEANSGSGSSGGTILEAPDGGLWMLAVTNEGVMDPRRVESGTPGTLHLFASNGTEWNVTVTNEGAVDTVQV